MRNRYHHHTSETGQAGIVASKSIRASLKANNSKNARYGDGQYVSDIEPGTKRPGQLSMIFFGMPYAGRRFSHDVTIDTKGLDVVFGRTHVWVIKSSGALDIANRLVANGKN